MRLLISCLFLFCLVGICSSAPENERILSLPALTEPMRSNQYSGYLDVSSNKSLYYWYIESESNPSSDPVVLWLNGGPGCSSLEGLFVEMGPYRTNDFGKTLKRNPWTWNRFASIIYLDAPAGVGFSWRGGNQSDWVYTDDEVANDNHAAIKMWFEKFPERKNNSFFVAGESYGGTYVPMLSALLVKDADFKDRLRGMLIGNGCVDDVLNTNTAVGYNYNHGFIDERIYRDTMNRCCPGTGAEACDYSAIVDAGVPCSDDIAFLTEANYYTGLDPYFLYYSCYLNPTDSPNYSTDYKSTIVRNHMRKTGANVRADALPSCSHYNDSTVYLQRDDVMKALNIRAGVPKYESCSDAIANQYDFGQSHLVDQKENVKAVVNAGIRVMLFNGDTDSICNAIHNAQFVEQLGLSKVSNETTWGDKTQKPPTIGMITRYEGLDFLTVRGAGHFVSSSNEKPKEALQMFYNFINNQDYSTPIGSDNHATTSQPNTSGSSTVSGSTSPSIVTGSTSKTSQPTTSGPSTVAGSTSTNPPDATSPITTDGGSTGPADTTVVTQPPTTGPPSNSATNYGYIITVVLLCVSAFL